MTSSSASACVNLPDSNWESLAVADLTAFLAASMIDILILIMRFTKEIFARELIVVEVRCNFLKISATGQTKLYIYFVGQIRQYG